MRIKLIIWNLVNLILFGLILSNQSTGGTILGRYTPSYAVGIGLTFIVISLIFLFTAFPSLRQFPVKSHSLHPLNNRTMVIAASLVLIGSTALWALQIDARYIKLFLTFNVVYFVVLLLDAPLNEVRAKRWELLLGIVLVILLFFGVLTVRTVPEEQSSGDEASWTSYAEAYLTNHQIYYKVMNAPPITITPGIGYWVVIYAAWLHSFGITLASGRLFIWLIYVIGVACIGVAGWRLYSRWIGLVSAILTAASMLVLSYRIIRPEIGLPIVGALLIVLYLSSEKRPLWAFFAGWLAVLSLEIHAAGLAYILGIIGMYAIDLLKEMWQRRSPFQVRYVAFALGGLVGAGFFVVMHILILPEPAYYFQNLGLARGFMSSLPQIQTFLTVLQNYWQRAALEFCLLVLSLVALAFRRTRIDLLLLRFFLLTLIPYVLLVPGPERYLIVFTPFVAISIGVFLSIGFSRRLSFYSLSTTALLCLCGPFLALMLPQISLANPLLPTQPTVIDERIRALSDPNSVVVGDIFSYWALTDYQGFYADIAEYEDGNRAYYGDGYRLWQALEPDVVFHVAYPGFPSMPPQLGRYINEYHYHEVDSFIANNYLVHVWYRPGYQPEN
jgi:hypothetical protein